MKDRVSIWIQARTASSRLPGKVLLKLEGKAVLEHVVERLRQVRQAHGIVLLTSRGVQDQPLLDLAKWLGIDSFAGSEADVLNRYYEASKIFQARHIVRVTGDCPLLDPDLLNQMILHHLRRGNHYTSTAHPPFPQGIGSEIFRQEDLKLLEEEARDPYEREHVTPFFYFHPERFRVEFLEPEPWMKRPDLRLTLDTPEDFQLIQRIYQSLYQNGKIFTTRDLIQFLDEHPEIRELNQHIRPTFRRMR